MSRKPIQLTTTAKQIYALCDDGSMWRIGERSILDNSYHNLDWERLPSIPYRANIYLMLGVDEVDKAISGFLDGWRIDIDAMSDDKRYLKCSKHSKKFVEQDYKLLDKYSGLPKGWPDGLS